MLIFYGVDVARNDPFQELIVCSPDTDVFLLLISFYKCFAPCFELAKVVVIVILIYEQHTKHLEREKDQH